MSKMSRRRVAVTSAAVSLAIASSGVSASDAAVAPSLDTTQSAAGGSLSTVFSCGSRWTTAKICATLCPTGDDDACPPGQYCYGGIPCETGEGDKSMEDILERQHHLEQQEMDRLARRRDEEYVDRFVCGGSYDEAAESCAGASPSSDGGSLLGGTETAFYCPSGSSDQCPAGTRCYAAVSCPRSTHDEEPPLGGEITSALLHSFLVTEPILLNATTVEDRGGNDRGSMKEEWTSFLGGSSSAVLGAVSDLLPSRYGWN